MLRSDIREDRRMTISRFRSRLCPELQRELIPHTVNTLKRVFQMVQELEKYLKLSNVVNQTDSQRSNFHVGTSVTRSSMTPTSTTNLVKSAKGKRVLVDTRVGGTQRCYKCQSFGHFAVQAQQRGQQEICGHTSTNKLTINENLTKIFMNPNNLMTSIFHTYIKSEDKDCKVVIDNGSCINMVSMLIVSRLGLSPKKHLVPYRVAWNDNTSSMLVTQWCHIPIQFSSYKDHVWCDVVDMVLKCEHGLNTLG
ncbi:unnamed protein product [Prunus armeniaca]|uniref:CCHC-type domain-containing protein n=1 Tax=Prunus armeniaca TaxID=36596 RepID=A0A6J5X9W6_PRUAR|nr:unnamed protein product [Prunus armeniaca]